MLTEISLFPNSPLTVLIKKVTVLYHTCCVLHSTITALSTIHAKLSLIYISTISTVLLLYFHVHNAMYKILGIVMTLKKYAREISRKQCALLFLLEFCLRNAVLSLRLRSLFVLLLFLTEIKNFVAGTTSCYSSSICCCLVVFFAC